MKAITLMLLMLLLTSCSNFAPIKRTRVPMRKNPIDVRRDNLKICVREFILLEVGAKNASEICQSIYGTRT